MGRFGLLPLLAALILTTELGFGHPLMAGLGDETEIQWGNPAIRPIRQTATTPSSQSDGRPSVVHPPLGVPIGLIAIVVLPDRSPVYAAATGDWSEIDLTKTLVQARHPDLLILNPPDGPDRVVIVVSSTQITVDVPGADGTALIGSGSARRNPVSSPAFLPVARLTGSIWEIDLGLAASTGYPALVPDHSLAAAIDARKIEPDRRYSLTGDAFADASVAASLRLVRELDAGRAEACRVGVRIYVPVSLAHARADGEVTIQTGDSPVPAAVETGWSVSGWYPGAGLGVGARVDAGIAVDTGSWTFGAGIQSLIGVFAGHGVQIDSPDQRRVISYPSTRPVPTLTVRYARENQHGTRLHAVTRWSLADTLSARAGLRVTRGALSVLGGIGWEGSLVASIGVGVRVLRTRVDVGLRSVQSPAVAQRRTVPPIGVSITLTREGHR